MAEINAIKENTNLYINYRKWKLKYLWITSKFSGTFKVNDQVIATPENYELTKQALRLEYLKLGMCKSRKKQMMKTLKPIFYNKSTEKRNSYISQTWITYSRSIFFLKYGFVEMEFQQTTPSILKLFLWNQTLVSLVFYGMQ
jgi:hypothetical protein